MTTSKEYLTSYKTQLATLDRTDVEMHDSYVSAYDEEMSYWSDPESPNPGAPKKRAGKRRTMAVRETASSKLLGGGLAGAESKKTIVMGGTTWDVLLTSATPGADVIWTSALPAGC